MISVVLADDHPVVRTGLRLVIEQEPDMDVAADTGSAEDLISWLDGGGRADVALLDLDFGPNRLTGAEATRTVVHRFGIAVLVVTTYGSDADILSAVEAGATGYLLKDAPTADLTRAIRAAAVGEVTFGQTVQSRLIARMLSPTEALTARELEVLRLVAAGRSNDEIARELFLTIATVKTHLSHINGKLGARSRTQAVATARQRGILAP